MKPDYPGMQLEVIIYGEGKYGEGCWAQAKYLVHGIDDVLWTNDIESVITYFRDDLERLKLEEATHESGEGK